MSIFGSFFRQAQVTDVNADIARKQERAFDARPTVIGIDVGRDEWVTECVSRVNDDGTLTVVDMKRFRPSQNLDLKAE